SRMQEALNAPFEFPPGPRGERDFARLTVRPTFSLGPVTPVRRFETGGRIRTGTTALLSWSRAAAALLDWVPTSPCRVPRPRQSQLMLPGHHQVRAVPVLG